MSYFIISNLLIFYYFQFIISEAFIIIRIIIIILISIECLFSVHIHGDHDLYSKYFNEELKESIDLLLDFERISYNP